MSYSLNLKATYTGHRAAVYALAAGDTAGTIYSAGSDALVVAWGIDNPQTGEVVAQAETSIFCLAFLPEHNILVAGNQYGGLHWIDLSKRVATKNVLQHDKGVYKLLAYGNNTLFSLGGDGCLTRWDISKAKAVETLKLSHKALRSVTLQLNEKGEAQLLIGSSDGCIYVVNPDDMTWRGTLKHVHEPTVFALCTSKEGFKVYSGGRDAQLRVWDGTLFGGDSLGEIEAVASVSVAAHRYTINDLCLIENDGVLISASRDRTLRIWDTETMALKKVIDAFKGGHSGSINQLLWHGGLLYTASDDKTVRVFEVIS